MRNSVIQCQEMSGCSHTQADNETAIPNAVIVLALFASAIEEPAAEAICYPVVCLAGRPSVR